MQKKALIILAEGFEEVEAITPLDYLRRAGVAVTICALGDKTIVYGSHKIPVLADCSSADLESNGQLEANHWDALLLPGGIPGARYLSESHTVVNLVKAMAEAGKIVAAICAAPALVLFPAGVLQRHKWTCYPGMEQVGQQSQWVAEPVVTDGNIITSRGAGTAGQWAIALIRALMGEEQAASIASSVLL
ncbi:MAG: DJ-1/PfpI family protein [Spirochaetaceae bacterium]|nr:DJ-1/PfpI family protein [Spirochaetaceae bacterium]